MHHVKDEMLEPNLETAFDGPIQNMEGPLNASARTGDVTMTVQAN